MADLHGSVGDQRAGPGLVSIPTKDWIYTRAALSMIQVLQNLPQRTTFEFNTTRFGVAAKRNDAARQVLEGPAPWVLFLDADMVHPPDILPRLLRHDVGVVGGLYVTKNPPYYPEAGFERGARSDDPLRPTDAETWSAAGWRPEPERVEPVEVDVLGAGAMLVRREVLEAVDPPFVANQQGDGNSDYNFCLRAKEAGFRVLCDPDVRCEHIGGPGVTVEAARLFWDHQKGG